MSVAALGMLALIAMMGACGSGRPNGEPCLKASDCDSSVCRGGVCVAEPVNTLATSSSGPSSSSSGGNGGMGGSGMGGSGGTGGSGMGGMGGTGGSGMGAGGMGGSGGT